MENIQYKIFSELDEIKTAYEGNSLEKIAGLRRSQYKVIKMCEYYSDSRYLGTNYHEDGNQDKLDRPVPFYNIVNYRVTLAKTATDLDIKDIQIISDNPKYQIHSMLLNRESYEWMKENEFSKTLNEMGYTRPKYGGYLIKKTEKGGDLDISLVRWTNVRTDQNDILAGPIDEEHQMSPVAIKKMEDSWNNVDEVLKAYKKMKAADRLSTIEVREITGEFEITIFNNTQDETDTKEEVYTYSLQRYFIALLDGKKYLLDATELPGKMTDYYEYLGWEENGYGLDRGVIEDSEEAQVWINDAVMNEAAAMNLAGRVGVKTNSKKLGNSVLEHDHGKIYELGPNEDINSFSLTPSALGQYQNQIEKWQAQADNTTSSHKAATGEQPPSGTPYSQTALLNQVASQPFDYQREKWGIHLTKIWDNWVIPHLLKKIRKEHILVSEFSDVELEMIDKAFINKTTNEILKEAVLAGEIPTPEDQANIEEGIQSEIFKKGKKRFIKVPEDFFRDVEAKTTVLVTGEMKNKAVIMQSLSAILQTVIPSFNPQTGEFAVLSDPTLSRIFNEILEIANTGVSPMSLGKGASPTQVAPQGQTPQAPALPEAGAPAPSAPLAPTV